MIWLWQVNNNFNQYFIYTTYDLIVAGKQPLLKLMSSSFWFTLTFKLFLFSDIKILTFLKALVLRSSKILMKHQQRPSEYDRNYWQFQVTLHAKRPNGNARLSRVIPLTVHKVERFLYFNILVISWIPVGCVQSNFNASDLLLNSTQSINCFTVKPLITNTSKEFIKCRILHFLIMECCRYLVFVN